MIISMSVSTVGLGYDDNNIMMFSTRDAGVVDFSAASAASASALPLPQKCSYFIYSYPIHECGSGWLS